LVGRVFRQWEASMQPCLDFQLFSHLSGIKLVFQIKNCTVETSLTSSINFLQNLSEGAALDLVAVLSGNELFVVGLVLAGHES